MSNYKKIKTHSQKDSFAARKNVFVEAKNVKSSFINKKYVTKDRVRNLQIQYPVTIPNVILGLDETESSIKDSNLISTILSLSISNYFVQSCFS